MVEHNIGKQEFSFPNNCVPVTKSQLKSLELENQEMKYFIYALNEELADAKKMLVDNQPLVSVGAQLSKLNSTKKQPSLLATDIFCDMDQAVMPNPTIGNLYWRWIDSRWSLGNYWYQKQ